MEKWQKKILLLCWLAYAAAYIGRANLAIALPGMSSSFHWNNAASGIIGSAFFWAYAIGQLVNGYIGDGFKSRYFIFIGLFMSAAANFAVGLSSNFSLTLVLWAFNGFFLSMLWGPIVKTVSAWFPENKGTRISVILSLSMIAGYLFSWGAMGQAITALSWRFAFFIPAALLMAYSFVWVAKVRDHPNDVGIKSPAAYSVKKTGGTQENSGLNMREVFIKYRLFLIAVACFVQGFIKDGLSLWAPTFLKATQNINSSDISLISLVIPIMSMAGILCSGWLNKRFHGNERRSVLVLFSCSVIAGIILLISLGSGIGITVVLLSIIDACMYGANTLLLTIIPLKFRAFNKVSAVAGCLDFCSYIGAASSGVLTGFAADMLGWKSVVASWSILSAIGIVSLILSKRRAENI